MSNHENHPAWASIIANIVSVFAPVRLRRKALAVAGVVVLASAAAACSGGPSHQTEPSSTASLPSGTAKFDPKNFVDPLSGGNSWYPLVAGTQTLRDGSIHRGSRKLHHQLRVTVTDVTKEINGVKTVAVLDQDIDAGQVGEASLDYLAQDKSGNVWYLGSYTELYEGGQFVNANDAWLAGKKDARPGVWMMASPKAGMKYIEAQTSRETIHAEVKKVGDRKCVPFKCFKALVILEDGSEFKYFASGVGHIATEPNYSGGEQEKEALINAVKLKPQGLAEFSGEALKLDKRARREAKSVFGDSDPGRRP